MQLAYLLGAGAAVLLIGVLGVRASSRLGLPALLLFLGIGLVIGEAGLDCGSPTPSSPSSSVWRHWC